MRRLRSDNPSDFSFFCDDGDPLGKHNLSPPAANGLKTDKAFICDLCHHKADFIQMSG